MDAPVLHGVSEARGSDARRVRVGERANAQLGQSGSALTVLVPTRNERESVARLIERLERVDPGLPFEVLFVDDSGDDTPEVIERAAARSELAIKVIHRAPSERHGGLGGAVRAGLSDARSEWVCVMDGDLQHPPELLGTLVDEARRSAADVVVASRYRAGGGVGDFSALRRALSRGSALLARALYPRRLCGVSDPMSGFFLVRRAVLEPERMRPRGFKILLEILLSGQRLRTSEVAFRFDQRHAGHSKASLLEGARYVRRLIELRVGERAMRLVAFAAVGGVGVLVNTAMLALLAVGLHIWYLLASAIATQVAILSNYWMSDRFVFAGIRPVRSVRVRLMSYVLLNEGMLALTAPLLLLLVGVLAMPLLVANVLSLLALALARFVIADAFVWGSAPLRPREWPIVRRLSVERVEL